MHQDPKRTLTRTTMKQWWVLRLEVGNTSIKSPHKALWIIFGQSLSCNGWQDYCKDKMRMREFCQSPPALLKSVKVTCWVHQMELSWLVCCASILPDKPLWKWRWLPQETCDGAGESILQSKKSYWAYPNLWKCLKLFGPQIFWHNEPWEREPGIAGHSKTHIVH